MNDDALRELMCRYRFPFRDRVALLLLRGAVRIASPSCRKLLGEVERRGSASVLSVFPNRPFTEPMEEVPDAAH